MKADPPCFDNANRYVNCGNGTVTDTVTGLVWLENVSCIGIVNYAAANQAAAELQDGDCGLSDNSSPGDWRLPTIAEWKETIARAVALSCTVPNAPSLTNSTGDACYSAGPQPFPGVQSAGYWSSTSLVGDSGAAWFMFLANGSDNVFGKPRGHYGWPVRGGK